MFLFVGSWLFPHAPMPLVAILLAALVAESSISGPKGSRWSARCRPGLPAPRLPDIAWSDLQPLLLPPSGVTVVAYTDNALTGAPFAAGGYPIDANQELLALGGANAAAGLVAGFPVSSSRQPHRDRHSRIGASSSLVVVAAVVMVLLLFLGRCWTRSRWRRWRLVVVGRRRR